MASAVDNRYQQQKPAVMGLVTGDEDRFGAFVVQQWLERLLGVLPSKNANSWPVFFAA